MAQDFQPQSLSEPRLRLPLRQDRTAAGTASLSPGGSELLPPI